jgi:hypothetical protein
VSSATASATAVTATSDVVRVGTPTKVSPGASLWPKGTM